MKSFGGKKQGREEKGEVEVSNSANTVEQHNIPVATVSHLLTDAVQ